MYGVVVILDWVDLTGRHWLLVLGALWAIGTIRFAYDLGYEKGRRDILDPPHLRPLTEDQRTKMLMRATLPLWRRCLGVAAIIVPNVLIVVFIIGAPRYPGSGWQFLLAFVLYFVSVVVGIRAMERLWRPFRAGQEQARHARREKKLEDDP